MVFCGCSQYDASGETIPTPSNTSSNTSKTNDLLRHWVHSSEEQNNGNERIFRPKGSREFPPSRFRMEYVFRENGECDWYYLSPDDNHRFKKGTWQLDQVDGTILEIKKEDETERYRIKELTKDILRIDFIEMD